MLNLDNMLAWVDDLEADRLWMVDVHRRDPAQTRFQVDGLTQENQDSLRHQLQGATPFSRGAHRLSNILGDQLFSIGEAFTQEAADVSIDMLTIANASLPLKDVLAENGYSRFSRVG